MQNFVFVPMSFFLGRGSQRGLWSIKVKEPLLKHTENDCPRGFQKTQENQYSLRLHHLMSFFYILKQMKLPNAEGEETQHYSLILTTSFLESQKFDT